MEDYSLWRLADEDVATSSATLQSGKESNNRYVREELMLRSFDRLVALVGYRGIVSPFVNNVGHRWHGT